MQRLKGIPLHMTVAALALAVAGCSSDLSLNNLTLVPKPETMMRKPDWAAISPGKTDFSLRPVTPADLVNADGVCAAATGAGSGLRRLVGGGKWTRRGRDRIADDGMRRCATGRRGREDRCQR